VARKKRPRLTQAEERLRMSIGGHTGWARTVDRAARSAHAQKASPSSLEYHLARVDPDGVMTPENRAACAKSAQRAYMKTLALKSSIARRQKRAAEKAAKKRDGDQAAS
jgi:hypothetical protein